MTYIATITSTGQITIPKPIRDLLGAKVGSRLSLDVKDNTITIERQKTFDEITAQIDDINASLPQEAKALIKKYSTKTAHEVIDEYYDSPAGQEELRKINYGN